MGTSYKNGVNVFDDEFHKFQIFFDEDNVVVVVDCIQICILELPSTSGVSSEATISILENMDGYVQDLAIICGLTDREECCEFDCGICTKNCNSDDSEPDRGSMVSQMTTILGPSDHQCACPAGPAGPTGPAGPPGEVDIESIKAQLQEIIASVAFSDIRH